MAMKNSTFNKVPAVADVSCVLTNFLKEMKCPNDPFHTHISMGIPKGVYSFGSKMNIFWSIYRRALNKNAPMYLAENPGKETPILVDVDLRVKKSILPKGKELDRIYSREQVLAIVSAYQQAIVEVVDFSESTEKRKADALICVLLEKDPYETEIGGERYIKNGFHLHFPKLFLDKKVQEVYIIPKVKEKVDGLFDNIGAKDFLDTNSINVHWLMYGSKKQNGSPYKATKCFGKDVKEMSFEDALGDYVCCKFSRETDEDVAVKGRVEKMLHRILSIFLYDRADHYFQNPKQSVITPLYKKFEMVKIKRKQWDSDSVDKQLQEASKLIGMMNCSRSDDRSTWLRVGFCLWNICQGDNEGFCIWLEFSENSEKFSESECFSLWNKMRPSNFTIGTLKYYAKQDSPQEYADLVKEKTNHLIEKVINGCHNEIAKMLFDEYGNEFTCTTNKEWYQFKDHVWKPIDRGVAIRERISDDNGIVIKQLEAKKRELYKQINEADARVDEDEEDDVISDVKIKKQIVKKIDGMINKCKNAPFKNNIMEECRDVFYNPDFANLLNKNPYLIAFRNGVYDFENDIFRDGNPEDYLSMALPIDYYDYGSIDHPKVMKVDDFFQKVFPDREVREYFLDQVCQVFVGGNRNKVILFWTSKGNNGKTVTQTLFEKMLGRFAVKFSTSLLTGKKTQMGAASPELARAGDGVRWAVMDEPNADEMISSGTLKGLTGNDSFWARDLFQKGKETREIQPMFKLHMICNKLPAIKDGDVATWNRIRVIPFESTFVPESECPEDIDEQVEQKRFPMDKNFNDKIPSLIQPLAWFLIQRWKNVKNYEQVEPEKVKVATDTYMRENDVFRQFEQQCVFDKPGVKLTPTTLYSYFKEWYRDETAAGGSTMPTRNIIRQHFVQKWGDLANGKYWMNKTCQSLNEEEEEDST
jgi:P4 family phage/plasmid primase-like protien